MKLLLLITAALTTTWASPVPQEEQSCSLGYTNDPAAPQDCDDHCGGRCVSQLVETSWGKGYRCDCTRTPMTNACCDWVFIPGSGTMPYGSCTPPICPGASDLGCAAMYYDLNGDIFAVLQCEPNE